jgi:hypothetical protein
MPNISNGTNRTVNARDKATIGAGLATTQPNDFETTDPETGEKLIAWDGIWVTPRTLRKQKIIKANKTAGAVGTAVGSAATTGIGNAFINTAASRQDPSNREQGLKQQADELAESRARQEAEADRRMQEGNQGYQQVGDNWASAESTSNYEQQIAQMESASGDSAAAMAAMNVVTPKYEPHRKYATEQTDKGVQLQDAAEATEQEEIRKRTAAGEVQKHEQENAAQNMAVEEASAAAPTTPTPATPQTPTGDVPAAQDNGGGTPAPNTPATPAATPTTPATPPPPEDPVQEQKDEQVIATADPVQKQEGMQRALDAMRGLIPDEELTPDNARVKELTAAYTQGDDAWNAAKVKINSEDDIKTAINNGAIPVGNRTSAAATGENYSETGQRAGPGEGLSNEQKINREALGIDDTGSDTRIKRIKGIISDRRLKKTQRFMPIIYRRF